MKSQITNPKEHLQIIKTNNFVDFDIEVFSTLLLKYLKDNIQQTYTDNILDEHIYNIGDLIENIEEFQPTLHPKILKQFDELLELLIKNDVGYFRIIKR